MATAKKPTKAEKPGFIEELVAEVREAVRMALYEEERHLSALAGEVERLAGEVERLSESLDDMRRQLHRLVIAIGELTRQRDPVQSQAAE